MRPVIAITIFLLLGLAGAQRPEETLNPYVLLENPQQIAEVINTATSEILLSAPIVQHVEIAEALRRAMVERGVPVFILTTVNGANNGASYIHALYLTGAHVRIAADPEPMIVVDRTYVVAGPLIARPMAPTALQNETFLLSEPSNTLRLTSIFVQLFEQSLLFEYHPEL